MKLKWNKGCRIQQMIKTKLLINNRFTIANAILQPTDIEKQGVISHQFFPIDTLKYLKP